MYIRKTFGNNTINKKTNQYEENLNNIGTRAYHALRKRQRSEHPCIRMVGMGRQHN